MSSGKYQFHSWARRGITSHIIEKDTLGKSPGDQIEHAKTPISVRINNNITEDKIFSLLGPGDVTGISNNMIIRTSPLTGAADFEPGLLPYIEFYDEDFPFRYTPASASDKGRHLRPWLALLVLKETEFIDTRRRTPLSSIRIINRSVLPPHDQLHLWAHMHSNLPRSESSEQSNFEAFLEQLEDDIKTDPDGVYSRLICPRKLESKTAYHAFLVPSFETGRLAGLGQNSHNIKAQAASFLSSDNEFPVYYRWDFRTADNFDFEYLVKQLKPRVMDKRVGVRAMDCSGPGFVRADSNEEVRATVPPILPLEGAVIAPDAQRSRLDNYGEDFSDDLQKLLNLNRSQLENTQEDPFVSVPFYGMNHAMKKNRTLPGKAQPPVFDPSANNWYNSLNKNPIYRVPAGFGKRVVQENQDQFMDTAWKQLKKIQDANKKAKLTLFTRETMRGIYNKTLRKKDNESYLLLTQAISAKVLNGQTTVKAQLNKSQLETGYLDPAFRRLTRTSTSLIKGINSNTRRRNFSLKKTIRKVNKSGGITPEVAEKFNVIPKLDKLSVFQPPNSINNLNVWSTQSNLRDDYAFNLPGFTGGLPGVQLWSQPFIATQLLPTPQLTPPQATLAAQPIRPSAATRPPFRLQNPQLRSRLNTVMAAPVRPLTLVSTANVASPQPVTPRPTQPITPGVSVVVNDNLLRPTLVDTTTANQNLSTREHTKAMKNAYKNLSDRFGFSTAISTKPTIKTSRIRKVTDTIINPESAYKRMFDSLFQFPSDSLRPRSKQPVNDFLTAMAYPDIPEPTYRHLLSIDKEFLLPNLKLIENNTLSLLKTNQKFIESYLIGLNHEMNRELLWNAFPSDSRGTCFRQFWDVNGLITPDTTPTEAELMKDIRPIHLWKRSAKLGKNNIRSKRNREEQLVFVIRGDLLKKFPNTVIYAQKALLKDKEKIIRTEFNERQEEKEIRFPQFQAEIEPDIKLLGFDLSIDEALGNVRTSGFNDKWGWFFVISEVPGEPQFGMDIGISRSETADWNDLSWAHLPNNLSFVQSDIKPSLSIKSGIKEKWGASSSDMAAILLQRPVMVAIHASEMLRQSVATPGISDTDLTLKAHLDSISTRLAGL